MKPILSSQLKQSFLFGTLGIILVFWSASFIRMLAGGNEQTMMVVYFILGFTPLAFYLVLRMVRRYDLYEDRLVIRDYWKKEKESIRWDEFKDYDKVDKTNDGTMSGPRFEGVVLNRKSGKRTGINNTWVSNFSEIEKFISEKVQRAGNKE